MNLFDVRCYFGLVILFYSLLLFSNDDNVEWKFKYKHLLGNKKIITYLDININDLKSVKYDDNDIVFNYYIGFNSKPVSFKKLIYSDDNSFDEITYTNNKLYIVKFVNNEVVGRMSFIYNDDKFIRDGTFNYLSKGLPLQTERYDKGKNIESRSYTNEGKLEKHAVMSIDKDSEFVVFTDTNSTKQKNRVSYMSKEGNISVEIIEGKIREVTSNRNGVIKVLYKNEDKISDEGEKLSPWEHITNQRKDRTSGAEK